MTIAEQTPLKEILSESVKLKSEDIGELIELLKVFRTVTERLAIIGGVPRDFFYRRLLGEPIKKTLDLDITFEGNISEIRSKLEEFLKERGLSYKLTIHQEFQTGELIVYFPRSQEHLTIDFARAREEEYPKMASLPVVAPSTIERDILRRDFTVNAIALEIGTSGEVKRLIAPLIAFHDLVNRVLRPLHERSFLDDPTRILRGIRYASRLKMSFHPDSFPPRKELERAFANLSRERFTEELRLILEEYSLKRALKLLSRLDILSLWSGSKLKWCPQAKHLKRLQSAVRHSLRWSKAWKLSFNTSLAVLGCLILTEFPLTELTGSRALALRRDEVEIVRFAENLKQFMPISGAKFRREVLKYLITSKVFQRSPLEASCVVMYALKLSNNRGSIWKLKKALKRWLFEKPLISGYTLETLGIAQKEFSKILQNLRFKQISGEIKTRNQALKFIRRIYL